MRAYLHCPVCMMEHLRLLEQESGDLRPNDRYACDVPDDGVVELTCNRAKQPGRGKTTGQNNRDVSEFPGKTTGALCAGKAGEVR
jgi:hypothetical protein